MKKRIQSSLLALALLLGLCTPMGGLTTQAAAETEATSGSWGDNITWELDGTTLYIRGEGPMQEGEFEADIRAADLFGGEYHFNDGVYFSNYPWYQYSYDSDNCFTNVVIEEGITTIATGAFYTGAEVTLTSVTIPESVISIGDFAFAEAQCLALELPSSVQTIGEYAFHDALVDSHNLVVPESVTSIGKFAFSSNSLASVTFSEGLMAIEDFAFSAFTADPIYTQVTLPSSLTKLGDFVFVGNPKLADVHVAEGNEHYCSVDGVVFDQAKEELILYPAAKEASEYVISDKVTEIHAGAFYGNPYIKTVMIPDAVNKIGEYSFYGCEALTTANMPSKLTELGKYSFAHCDLVNVVLPVGMTKIGDYAFYSNTLWSIDIPESVTAIGEGAFANSTLLSLTLPSKLTEVADYLCYEVISLSSVTIPNSVRSIGDRAFYGCKTLEDFILPDGILTIGQEAFYDCKTLNKIELPNSVTFIGAGAFNDCNALTEINIPDGVKSIEEYTFNKCYSLAKIDIPDSVTSIGDCAFRHCYKLTDFEIPDKVISIGSYAFGNGRTVMEELVIPSSVRVIGDYAFYDHTGLKNVTIQNGVEEIPYYAFGGCSGLNVIVIPKSVTTVKENAFYGCRALEKVHYGDTCAKWDEITICEGNDNLTDALIYCTDGYYGVDDPNRPAAPAKIKNVEVIVYPTPISTIPLYSDVQVELSLENSWFDENEDLLRKKSDLGEVDFYGTVRIYSASGEMLYESDFPEVYDNRLDEGKTESKLSFELNTAALEDPIQPDQNLSIEIWDTEGNILAQTDCQSSPIQRWSFKNYEKEIDKTMIRDILGKSKGNKIIRNSKEPLGSDGLCFGMALTASLINYGAIAPTLFEDCVVLDQVQEDTKMIDAYNVKNAEELIQMGQVLQHKASVQKQLDDNLGNYEGLLENIKGYQDGNCAMPLIYMDAAGIHAICAYDYRIVDYDVLSTLHIICYDNAFPYRIGEIMIYDWDEPENSNWEYVGIDGYYGDQNNITFVQPAGFTDNGVEYGTALMSMDPDNMLTTKDGQLLFTAIKYISNGDTASEADVKQYWLTGSGSLSVEDIDSEFSIADDFAIYTISSAAEGTFTLTEGEVDVMSASGEMVSLTCEYFAEDDTVICITFQGTPTTDEDVSLVYHPETETVEITGAKEGTVTVVYDDEDENTDDHTWVQSVASENKTIEVTADGQKVPVVVVPNDDIDDSGSHGSGDTGSSSGGSTSVTYPITTEKPQGGSVSVDPAKPKEGDRVTITATPDAGYEVEDVVVLDRNGNKLEVTDHGDGTYSFVQPVGKVTIRVAFEERVLTDLFADVTEDAYYYDAVRWAVENGITSGTSATTFSPNQACTRAQAVTFLWHAAGNPEPESTEMPFTDVKKGSYYYKAVLWAVEQDITSGTSATTFSPNNKCTRAQIVTFLWRADETSPKCDGSTGFSDVSVSAYYWFPVRWAVKEGITSGTSATTFSPNADCTRAQIVTFLYRALAA